MLLKRRSGAALLVGLALLLPPLAHARAQVGYGTWVERMSPDLAAQATAFPTSFAPKRVIVQFRHPGVNVGGLARYLGGVPTASLPAVGGAALAVPYNALPQLASL